MQWANAVSQLRAGALEVVASPFNARVEEYSSQLPQPPRDGEAIQDISTDSVNLLPPPGFPRTPEDSSPDGSDPAMLYVTSGPLEVFEPDESNPDCCTGTATSDAAGLELTYPDVISWPWLHESLYLQGNPFDDLFPSAINFSEPLSGALDTAPNVNAGEKASQGDMRGNVVEEGGTSRELSSTLFPRSLLDTGGVDPVIDPVSVPPRNRGTIEQTAQTDAGRSQARERLVQELAKFATQPMLESGNSRMCYWSSMSLRVADTFGIGQWQELQAETPLLKMLELYKRYFSPLWPLLTSTQFDPKELHPALFLTLVSIGGMYGTSSERCFSTALHEEIRKVLLNPLFTLEDNEEYLLPLGQARLLTQVAALYFGQRLAFSYAQHLGAVIVAQARRMDLFSAQRSQSYTANQCPDKQLKVWLHLESRKRLAFGILRADVFTSVLMNSRPLLSSEEIDLELPAPDSIWTAVDMNHPEKFLDMIRSHTGSGRDIRFSDLVRIAFDRSEALLDMEPMQYELLLFGLQEPIWRFSHDPNIFVRLTGEPAPPYTTNESLAPETTSRVAITQFSSDSNDDQLGIAHRRMSDLRDHRDQLIDALHKWEKSFVAVRTRSAFQNERTSIMSSLLLLKLSHLRLTAPLSGLHGVAYSLSNKQSVETRTLHSLTLWARSREALIAADLACQIWRLLNHEAKRPAEKRAKHNLLAFSGLHHAAVVIWVVSGSQEGNIPDSNHLTLGDDDPIPLHRLESTRLTKKVVQLYKCLNPVGWCSFAVAAERLTHFTFPAMTCDTQGTFSFGDG
ncbi:hypothetical protein Plec18167_001831 [Paecilomyces lecythidis]|uniref:Xylanolytic transcriptional activator regulatory domain-containing protein n=1 Tax=Paecilomyces lecythidis TaxID=3004212 RepID=A0ABR3YA37_9EURO